MLFKKKCSVCKRNKRINGDVLLSDFAKNKRKKDGFCSCCKLCTKLKRANIVPRESCKVTQLDIYNLEVAVCDLYGIKHERLHDVTRKHVITNARFMCWKSLREHYDMRYTEIARNYKVGKFNGSDHTTIIYGVRTIQNLIETEDKTRTIYNRLQQFFRKPIILEYE